MKTLEPRADIQGNDKQSHRMVNCEMKLRTYARDIRPGHQSLPIALF